ncbi:G-D-S-L family lipolytic protein [Ornithobacterium rhinotracheale]|uniref:SGNH/GDSL hydrolase family protein n=1 Tax=Ornithobacterium rhinotracheale TaxID=28251 RepID=UPI00129CDC27|nr:SGNH/GDSL hydrolase family protein [Ornithobacterium rhinotracheale]MRI63222.1 G-D-S-L family lipolytic protein [Ornithobacterium rhinotracheale]
MKINYRNIFLSASILFLAACNSDFDYDIENPNITHGDADFSKYVALGNSLTSGFADGALYRSAQENSYPAIIAKQMKFVGGGDFTQPLMKDDIGGFSDLFAQSKGTSFYGKLELKIVDGIPTPTPTVPKYTLSQTFEKGNFNNLGVAGAKSYHLLAPGYGNPANLKLGKANPYFVRFASQANASVLSDALAQKPTFFTLWIGNNDVLGYAMNGAASTDQKGNIDLAKYGSSDLSETKVVAGSIQKLIDALVKSGAKGAVANLPFVEDIPYFTTVPAEPLSPLNKNYASQINNLNDFYSKLNQVFDLLKVPERKISFSANKASGAVIVDTSLPDLSQQIASVLSQAKVPQAEAQLLAKTFGQVRQSKAGDLLPLTVSKTLGKLNTDRKSLLEQLGLPTQKATLLAMNGLTYPLQDANVLTQKEVEKIHQRVADINQDIKAMAQQYQIAYVDMNAEMQKLTKGFKFNGADYNASFVTGGAFSLDGVHLNSRGYAIAANAFLRAINHQYKASIPLVDINAYPGTQLP